MKFDYVIGNPPYQEKTNSNSTQSIPLYPLFVKKSVELCKKSLCMIIPSRWFAGGMGLDDFRKYMLNNKKICKLVDWTNAKDCFPSLSIGGGVCYFVLKNDYNGQCKITNVHGKKENTLLRDLNEFGNVFVRYNDAIKILRKISIFKEDSFEKYVTSLSPFGLDSKERGNKDSLNEDDLKLYSSAGSSFIEKNKITSGKEYINKYKIMVSKVTAEHAGEPDKNGKFKVLSTTKLLYPNEVCTFSYFLIGVNDDIKITENILSYIKTKFFRFLLLLSISSINLSKEKFKFIPCQDFSKSWSDFDLYQKYKINKDEQEFINSMIKEME